MSFSYKHARPAMTVDAVVFGLDETELKVLLIRRAQERRDAWAMVEELDIKTPDVTEDVSLLSGGNQQKVNVAKWLAADSRILIIDEPTVGVDVGALEVGGGVDGHLLVLAAIDELKDVFAVEVT